MQKFILLIFSGLLLGLSCQDDKSSSNGIEINPDFIKAFTRNEDLYPENPDYEFLKVAKYSIDLNNNKQLDTITLRVIKDWSDPGDFHQIQIILDNNVSFYETNFDGWVRFGENYPVNEELQGLNKVKSDLILVTDFSSDKKLVFAFGWVYASEPGLLSIFEANGSKPKVIFNTNFEITKLGDDSFTGEFHETETTIELRNNRFEYK